MSVEQIEQQIRQLPADELARFTQWFGGFLAVLHGKQDHPTILEGRQPAP